MKNHLRDSIIIDLYPDLFVSVRSVFTAVSRRDIYRGICFIEAFIEAFIMEDMQKYDFTSILDRHGQDALAVDEIGAPGGFAPAAPEDGFDAIPMWVADMNFPTAPSVQKAIMERTAHPAFGYFRPRDAYYEAIIRWQRERNGVSGLTPDCIGYENGVLGGLLSALRVLCSRGDSILLHTPAYVGFTNVLRGSGYHIVESPLLYQAGDAKSGGPEGAVPVWHMDYEDMERKIRDQHIHVVVFCSPHNPCGRVWSREELAQAFEIFEKYEVTVISDEIWSDLLMPGKVHIALQSVSEYAKNHTVALYAPSKTFNLAGLVGSYHIIYNRTLRERVRREAALTHYNEMNVLSMHALLGAYSPEGAKWVDALRRVLAGNVRYAVDYIRAHFDGVTLAEPEGTYMLFPDCGQWMLDHGKSQRELEEMCWRVGVALQDGGMFRGPSHLRINLALPLTRVQEAMERLDRYVFNACPQPAL